MGLESKDIDFAVEAPSFDAMRQDLLVKGIKIFQERPEFLTIRGNHPEHGGVDYVLCRKDGAYSDGRHPDSVEIGTIDDDLARRDFTVNAIAYDGVAYYDPHNGVKDIHDKVLRCVGRAADRLQEDGLRILRALRFHIMKGFEFDGELEDCLNSEVIVSRLDTVKEERIREELLKCFAYDTLYTLNTLEFFPLIRMAIFKKGRRLRLEPTLRA
jgi:tRNA nucleotidyltransferase/poly(A) polymerase